MGHSKAEKAQSRERILAVAGERLRGEGIDGPGVAEIMRAAGLTHGGFYKHFGSRDELVREALGAAFDEQSAATRTWLAEHDGGLEAFVGRYASAEHCADPAHGCAVAAVVSEVARGDEALRGAYTERIAGAIDAVDGLLARDAPTIAPDARRAAAVARYAMLVGGLALARAVSDDELRAEILGAVRAAATQPAS